MITNQEQTQVEKARERDSYWVERVKLDFAIKLNKLRIKKEVSAAELARKLRKSPPYISRILKGDENLTIESMVKLSRSVGGSLKIEITDDSIANESWAKYFKNDSVIGASNEAQHLIDTTIYLNESSRELVAA